MFRNVMYVAYVSTLLLKRYEYEYSTKAYHHIKFEIKCTNHMYSLPFSQVHSLFTNCGLGWQGSSCHCGIAIRSRNSLFVLRTCETISRNDKHLLQQPITELKTCDDSDMLIDQYGNDYKVVCYGDFTIETCSPNHIISCYMDDINNS